jgi:signal transduction histidine kinase
MNAILGFAQLMEMDELNVEQRQGIEQILKGGRHLLA